MALIFAFRCAAESRRFEPDPNPNQSECKVQNEKCKIVEKFEGVFFIGLPVALRRRQVKRENLDRKCIDIFAKGLYC